MKEEKGEEEDKEDEEWRVFDKFLYFLPRFHFSLVEVKKVKEYYEAKQEEVREEKAYKNGSLGSHYC